MVRTKMQSEQLTYHEVGRAIQQTFKSNGLLSLWKGLGPTLLRDVPFSGQSSDIVTVSAACLQYSTRAGVATLSSQRTPAGVTTLSARHTCRSNYTVSTSHLQE